MSAAELLLSLAGGIIMLLLTVIAYFLKLLIQDLRQMGTDLTRMKESVVRLEAEQGLMKSILQRTRSPPTKSFRRPMEGEIPSVVHRTSNTGHRTLTP